MNKTSYSSAEMLDKLVSFDTTSRNSNLDLIQFVSEYLLGLGVKSKLVQSPDKTKANLLASIGPQKAGGVVLSGHTDVVPVDGQDWHSDPFKLIEKDDKYYGRGTADMKGFCAVVLAKVPRILSAKLQEPIHLAFSYDEEVGCIGVRDLLPVLKNEIHSPKAVIVGEPTSMKVATSHKGIKCMRTEIRGVEAHSAYAHQGESAIFAASKLIGYLSELAEKCKNDGPHDDRFNPPYTTINIGDIQGGSAINIIPNHCFFNWEHRPIPSQDPDEIPALFEEFAEGKVLAKMRERFDTCEIETSEWAFVPAFNSQPGSNAESLALALAGRNSTEAISFTTEAGLFEQIDFPTVVCGPGSMDQGHKPNEFVSRQQIEACEHFIDKLTAAFSAK